MAAPSTLVPARTRNDRPTIDIAGTAWPVYKLEALALGLPTGAVLLLITASPQTAVLSAAAMSALRWVAARRPRSRPAPGSSSVGRRREPGLS